MHESNENYNYEKQVLYLTKSFSNEAMYEGSTSPSSANSTPELSSPKAEIIPYKSLSVSDFTMIRHIGHGSYGKVFLVKRKGVDDSIYAMKVLKKAKLIIDNQKDRVINERNILQSNNHPFVIKLKYSFQDKGKLYLVTDYCPGGELFTYLQSSKKFGEIKARFYAANILLALEYFHEQNIIYRDLKPENVLLDQDGYLKLVDYGLSKKINIKRGRTKSFCGTPEYMAPEVVEKKEYSFAIDYWELGIFIYEMVTGTPPFHSENQEETFDQILSEEIIFPNHLSKPLIDLLSSLLRKEPSQRLGCLGGFKEIKNHPWFNTVDFEQMLLKKLKPPFILKKQSSDDPKLLSQEGSSKIPNFSPENNFEIAISGEKWEGFSYNMENEIKI